MTARASEVSSAAVMVMASARKKLPVTPVDGDERQKDDDRGDGGEDEGRG